MRFRIISLFLTVSLLAVSCSSGKGLEEMAMKRLPKALEKAMEEQMSVKGGADILSPETIYQCDSLCIIQFEAVAKDPSAEDLRFPVRYIFLRDVFMSAVTGQPYYAEMVTGCPTMSAEEIARLKESYQENGHNLYVYYSGLAAHIDKNNL